MGHVTLEKKETVSKVGTKKARLREATRLYIKNTKTQMAWLSREFDNIT